MAIQAGDVAALQRLLQASADPNAMITGSVIDVSGNSRLAVPGSEVAASWQPFGAVMNDDVSALTVFDSNLIIGGVFTTIGGQTARYIACCETP